MLEWTYLWCCRACCIMIEPAYATCCSAPSWLFTNRVQLDIITHNNNKRLLTYWLCVAKFRHGRDAPWGLHVYMMHDSPKASILPLQRCEERWQATRSTACCSRPSWCSQAASWVICWCSSCQLCPLWRLQSIHKELAEKEKRCCGVLNLFTCSCCSCKEERGSFASAKAVVCRLSLQQCDAMCCDHYARYSCHYIWLCVPYP